jgi:AraC family transcriptional regulator
MISSFSGSAFIVNSKPIRSRDYSVEVQRSGPAALPPIYHNLHVVAITLSGEPVIIRGDAGHLRSERLAPGEVSISAAGPGTRVIWPAGIHCLYIHLHPRLIRQIAAAMGGAADITLQGRSRLHDPIIRAIGFEIDSLVHTKVPLNVRAAHDLVMALAHHVTKLYSAPASRAVQVGARSLEEVLDVFRESDTTSCRVGSVAEWCSLSRSHFSHRIRSLTGLWPHTMVLGSRIEAAKHLLEQCSMPLSEVAYETGFADQSHLTRTLRRVTGHTPASYRSGRSAPP